MEYSLGIDLGTTFTAAAIGHAEQIEMITLGDRTVVTPSVVFVRADGQIVTGDAAARRAVSDPQRVVREFKRRLGDPTPLMVGGSPHSAAALLGYQLHDVLQQVNNTQGTASSRIVLTYPANWGPYRRELFAEVPKLAGIDNNICTITEPEAAAAYYAVQRELKPGDVVAVYDLGGGTFDATVVRKQADGIEILGSPEGIERLGGVDFDEAVLAHVDYALDGALGTLDRRDPQSAAALRQLRQDCVEAKETLSVDTETVIPVFLPGHHGEVRLTRAEFEDMVRAPIESTIQALRRALRSAHVEPAELAAIVLVGGSSRIPLVAQMISTELGRPTAVDTHPKYAVALGAAALSTSGTPSLATESERIATQPEPVTPTVVTEPVSPPPPPGRPVPPGPPEESGGEQPGGDGQPRGPLRRRTAVLLAAIAVIAVLGAVLGLGVSRFMSGPEQPVTQGAGGVPPATIVPAAPVPPAVTPQAASLATPTVTGTIGVAAPQGVAISPDGSHAYVTSVGASRLDTIDVGSGAVIQSIFLPQPPQFVTVAPDGRHAYVSCWEKNGTVNVVAVLDTATNAIVANVPVGQHPYALAATPDGRQVWVPDHNSSEIAVIDSANYTVLTTFKVAANPHSVAFTPDGRTAWVANHESNVVSVIDVATRAVTTTIPVPTSPHSVAVSADGRRAMAASYDAASVSVIDTSTAKILATIGVGEKPQSVAFAPDGKHAYVVNDGSNTVTAIDLGNNTASATVPVGSSPVSIALTPDGRRGYVTNSDSNSISVLATAG